MNKYEELLDEAEKLNINVDENFKFQGQTAGLYVDGNIALSHQLTTSAAKSCVLAEELGHHHTTSGNIIDQSDPQNRKQERQARMWAYHRQLSLDHLIQAYQHNCRTRYEIAEFLQVTEAFIEEGIANYRERYGTYTQHEGYYITFIPYLAIGKAF